MICKIAETRTAGNSIPRRSATHHPHPHPTPPATTLPAHQCPPTTSPQTSTYPPLRPSFARLLRPAPLGTRSPDDPPPTIRTRTRPPDRLFGATHVPDVWIIARSICTPIRFESMF